MKGLSSGIKVGLVVLVIAAGSYGMFKSVSEQASGNDGYHLWAKFHDASGLVDKSRVVIAGLTIGEISDRKLEGRYARVTVKVRKETQVWANAAVLKKSSSLLGEFYLEIDPGTPEILDDKGELVPNHLLKDGDEIPTSTEGTSIQELTTQVSRLLPHVDEVLLEVRNLAADTRDLINGPVANMAQNLDRAVAQDTVLIHSILDRTDHITSDIREVTKDRGPQVERILANVEQASKELQDLLNTTKSEVQLTAEDVRKRVEKIDGLIDEAQATLENTHSITGKIDNDTGTLGKLVNDPTIADNVEAITEDARGFTHSLFGLQTIVGLRTEYNFLAQISRAYFTVEIYPRPDKYYLLELVSDPRGNISSTFTVDANQHLVRYQTVDYPGFAFTLQYARKLDWLTLRMGIKQSSGGFGIDLNLFDNHLKVETDMFEFTFNQNPRLRVAIAYNFFRYLYVIAGLDDILNAPKYVDITGNDLSGHAATQYYFGRDPFLGVMIRFNDEDLRSLLFVGGSALAGAVK